MTDYKAMKYNANREEKEPSALSKWWDELPYHHKLKKVCRWFNGHYRTYIRYPYLSFTTGISNIIKWLPIIWYDRNWDYSYIYTVLEHKLKLTEKNLVENSIIADIEEVSRYLKLSISLVQKVRDEFYGTEYFDYSKSEMEFIPIEGSTNSKLEFKTLWEKYDDYLKKYPRAIKHVKANWPYTGSQDDKKLMCMAVADYNQEKAQRLLFKILHDKIQTWWD